ncbi:YetF domain-containing protein [Peribacillus simplex]|uniref:YetF domain-containing protein n=1 Tax=Peribacillus simplex TaxID=1478 RepID=UPI003D2B65CC
MKKARLTTDELEISLRLQNIGNIKGVELAILEPNGQISTTLKPEKVPATKEDIYIILILFELVNIISIHHSMRRKRALILI